MKGITPAAVQAAVEGNTENFIVATTPGGIEAQEARGQKEFVAMQTLPKDCPREDLEKLGFIFGEDADDLFVNVKFPDGWYKKATKHSMYNELFDAKDRVRGSIFYKAAFYDRKASMYLEKRYTYHRNYKLEDAVQFLVLDCRKIINETPLVEVDWGSGEVWNLAEAEAEEKRAKDWLNIKYPENENPLMYWDD